MTTDTVLEPSFATSLATAVAGPVWTPRTWKSFSLFSPLISSLLFFGVVFIPMPPLNLFIGSENDVLNSDRQMMDYVCQMQLSKVN